MIALLIAVFRDFNNRFFTDDKLMGEKQSVSHLDATTRRSILVRTTKPALSKVFRDIRQPCFHKAAVVRSFQESCTIVLAIRSCNPCLFFVNNIIM